jgi:hypothetical protein
MTFFKGFAAKSQGFSILPIGGRTMPQGMQNAAAAGEKAFRALQIIMTPLTASFRFLSNTIDFFGRTASIAFMNFENSAKKAFANSRILAFGRGFLAQSQGISLSGIAVSDSLQKAADAGGRAFQRLADAPRAFMSTLGGLGGNIRTFGSNIKQFMANPILNTQVAFGAFGTRLKDIGSNIKSFAANARTSFANLRTSGNNAFLAMAISLKTLDLSFLKTKFSIKNLKFTAISDFLAVQFSAKAMSAAVSFAASAMSVGLTAALVIIPMIIGSFQSAKAAAQQLAAEMVGGFSTTSYKEQGKAIDILKINLEDLRAETEKRDTDMPGLIFEALVPFDTNENVQALHNQQEAELELAKAQERRTNVMANAIYMNNENGRSLMLQGEDLKVYTSRVSAAAEKAGIDLTQLPKLSKSAREQLAVILRQQANDFRLAGYSASEMADMTAEEMENAASAVEEQSKQIDKNLADMFDPVKAYEDAKAVTDAIYKAFNTPTEVFNNLKTRLTDAAREAFDAAQEAAREAAKKADKEYDAPDFEFTPKINATQFLNELVAEGKKLDQFRFMMQNVFNLGGSQELIEGLSNLGVDAVPILQQLATMLPEEARKVVEGLNEQFSKFDEVATVNLDAFSQSIAKRATAARTAANSATQLIAMGFDPAQIRTMMEDPQLMQVLNQMYFELMSVPPELRGEKMKEFQQLTQDVYDAKNVETDGVTEAMKMSMAAAFTIAQNGAANIVAEISSQFGKTPEEVYKIFKQLEANGIDVPGFDPNQAPPSAAEGGGGGAGGGGTAGPKPDKNSGPNPPIGRKMAVKEGKNGEPIKIGMRDQYRIPKGWKKGASPNGKFVKKGTYWLDEKGRMHRVGYFADGSVENHTAMIAKGGIRVWAEPETGGEAYIPLGMNKRAKSSQILEQVAQQFGYGLVKYANGGFFGTAGSQMVGGGQFGTSSGQAVQTVVVPVQSKNETNFNGPIVGVNMEDAVRFAEQKKRQKALTR